MRTSVTRSVLGPVKQSWMVVRDNDAIRVRRGENPTRKDEWWRVHLHQGRLTNSADSGDPMSDPGVPGNQPLPSKYPRNNCTVAGQRPKQQATSAFRSPPSPRKFPKPIFPSHSLLPLFDPEFNKKFKKIRACSPVSRNGAQLGWCSSPGSSRMVLHSGQQESLSFGGTQ